MKKNRIRIKYVGAVAAALLAAAPVAATAVAPFVAPAVAQAADQGGTQLGGEVAGAADAEYFNAPQDVSDYTPEYQNGYHAEYKAYATGFQLAVQDIKGKIPQRAAGDPKLGTDKHQQDGYSKGYQYITSINKTIADKQSQIDEGGWKSTADATKAITDAQSAIDQVAQASLDTATPGDLSVLKNVGPNLSSAKLEKLDTPDPDTTNGTNAGQADGSAFKDPAKNADKSPTYQNAYDRAYGLARAQADASTVKGHATFSDTDSKILQDAYNLAYQAAMDGVADAKKDTTKQDFSNEDPDYAGYYIDGNYQYAQGFTEAATRALKGQPEESPIEKDLSYGGVHDGYLLAKKAMDEYNTAESLKTGNYTSESVARLQAAISAVKGVFDGLLDPNSAYAHAIKNLTDTERELAAAIHGLKDIPSQPGTPTVNPAPVFSYDSNFVANPTITVGSSFNTNAGIYAWTDNSQNTAIPSGNWQVSGSVDTSKPGTYTLTYTITNNYGRTATLTRTVTVQAASTLTESSASGVVYVTTAAGADLFSDNATSNALGRNLANGTAWKVFGIVKDANGDVVAYNLGGKQYVRAADVSTTPAETQKGIFTVRYPANAKWSIAVYNSNLQVQKLIKAGSSWQTFGTKTLSNGKSYFNLGGNQWVPTEYGTWIAK